MVIIKFFYGFLKFVINKFCCIFVVCFNLDKFWFILNVSLYIVIYVFFLNRLYICGNFFYLGNG